MGPSKYEIKKNYANSLDGLIFQTKVYSRVRTRERERDYTVYNLYIT